MPVVPPSDYINWVKRSLNRLAGAEMPQNGIIDNDYNDLVESFQVYERIEPDRIVGPTTQNHLIRANILIREYCEWIREVIKMELPGMATGSGAWATPLDHTAVRAYQEEFGPRHGGLQVDGWVGPHTEFVMLARSMKKVPSTSTDPVIEFDDDVVKGDKPMTEDEIKAITWIVIGRDPGIDWWSGLKIGWKFFSKLKDFAKGNPSAPTLSISDVSHALGDPDKALAEADAMKGMAYGMVDHAFHRVRSNDALKPSRIKGVTTEGFAVGYRKIQRRLTSMHVRTTSSGKAIMKRIAREPSKARALKFIYRGLFEVYRNRGALGGGHANAIRNAQRHCKFTYPELSVECGPREDLLR